MNSDEISEDGNLELYLAQFNGIEATLTFKDGQGETFSLGGEILIAVLVEEDMLAVADFRRVSLWIEHVEALGGQTAFAGPAGEQAFDPATDGLLEPFDMNFYYPRLGDLGPACQDNDAFYPFLEKLRGRLSWAIEQAEADSLVLNTEISLNDLVEAYEGAVLGLVFGPLPLDFKRLQAQNPDVPKANSLSTCTSLPPPMGTIHDQRQLKLCFVDLSGLHTAAASIVDAASGETLEKIVQRQIDGACEVWWSKGGVQIVPEPNMTFHPPSTRGTGFQVANQIQETNLYGTEASADAVEVYLVDVLGSTSNPHNGGGVTHRCYTSDAYIILEIGKAQHNKYLLAHEIGHVLGLAHPLGASGTNCTNIRNGSYCSVMVPDSPNSNRNTLNNLQVLEQAPPPGSTIPPGHIHPLGLVLTSLGGDCDWAPDGEEGFFHFVRDFPADDGTEASVPQPPALTWWTHSDVWNSINTNYAFNPDFSPVHFEPMRSAAAAITNHMFVRVHTCQRLLDVSGNPVQARAHLFLAVPGSSSGGLHRLTPVGGLLLQFPTTFPDPGNPIVLERPWVVPPGYPPDCCVFAVIESSLDPLPPDIAAVVANPSLGNFSTLFSHLATDNDVAQRNLHIHEVSPFRSATYTMLNYIQVDNPTEQPAPASLEVDSRLASGLSSLAVEVNGEQLTEIIPGSVARITMDPMLPSGGHLVARLRAQVPAGLSSGDSFPITLGIMVDNQQVGGFQHLLQVSSLHKATIQTLDWLYAALDDVAIISHSKLARRIVRSLELILWRESRHIKPPAGCLFWLWRLLGLRTGTWITELALLSEYTHQLARSLMGIGVGQEYRALGEQIQRLAILFQSGADIPEEQYVEQLRALADRIQERAGRLVRQSVA